MNSYDIRLAQADDIAFIYSSCLKSLKHDSKLGTSTANRIFFDNYKLVLDRILADNNTQVFVACKPDEPHVIFGYMIAEPVNSVLHYVFVKEAFWNLGIASSLFKKAFNQGTGVVSVTHKTRTAEPYMHNRNLIYNPYLLFKGV